MRDLRFVTAGLSLESAAEACGVDVRTFRRWEIDNRAPLAVQKLLTFLSGELMYLDPQFKGFRLRDGKLYHDQAPLGDIRAMRWTLAERDELRLTVKRRCPWCGGARIACSSVYRPATKKPHHTMR